MPVGRIIGWFRVKGIAESTPRGLWRRFRHNGAILQGDYFEYFAGAERAYAIEIAEPTAIEEPLLLNSLSPGLRPPQSFQYLSAKIAAPVIEAAGHKRKKRQALRATFA